MRKTRSQHIHCECHQKGHIEEDCPDNKPDGEHIPHTCCCQHISKCTCSLKKEHLESVLEDSLSLIPPKEQIRPRPTNMNSCQSKATFYTNNHHFALLGATNDPAKDLSTLAVNPSNYPYSLTNSTSSSNSQQDMSVPEQSPDSWFMSYEQAHQYRWLPVDLSRYDFDSAENLQDSSLNNSNYIASDPPSYEAFEQFDLLNPGFTYPSGGISVAEDYALVDSLQNDTSSQDGGWM
ncbi:hypothetical protein, variant [Exophiala oligosperma]|nr:hypothetical protein, variant [Exophiala oligosperma]KIW36591.1 hypothetical protein, variant [Exophiala oligosperma]